MSKTNLTPTTASSNDLDWNGDIQPEYDLSKMTIVRGKHAAGRGQPHTVTIHNSDGTATIQHFDGQGTQIREEQAFSMEATHRLEQTIVRLEPDVAALFPDDASVNEALRLMIRMMQTQKTAEPIVSQ
jgi:hypothetical protein